MGDLVNTLDDVLQGRIGIADAQRSARALSAGRDGVLTSTTEMQRQLAALQLRVGAAKNRDVQKWAGAMLMVEVLIGTGILNGAVDFIKKMAAGTQGRCPAEAKRYVAAMFDSVLAATPDAAAHIRGPLLTLRRMYLPDARVTLGEAAKDLRWFSWLFATIGGVSVLSLLQSVFVDHRLTAFFQQIVDGYNRITALLLAPFEPLLAQMIAWISAQLHVDLHIAPHWRAMFLLAMVWVAADARSNWQAEVPARAVAYAVLGTLGALAGVIVAGLTPIDGPWWAQGAIAGAPLFGLMTAMGLSMAIEAIVTREGGPLRAFARNVAGGAMIGAIYFAVAAGLSLLTPRGAGILAFGLAIIVIAIGSIRMGVRNGDVSALRHGLTSIGGFAVAALVLAANLAVERFALS